MNEVVHEFIVSEMYPSIDPTFVCSRLLAGMVRIIDHSLNTKLNGRAAASRCRRKISKCNVARNLNEWETGLPPPPNVMVYLCQRGVGMSCLEFVRVTMWSLAVASVGAALKFGTSDLC
jgi:hypothetical protein